MTDPTLLDGVLLIDKPVDLTSHDVVARLRRALNTKKVGHAGTLDPLATGLLPMLIGRGTKLAPYLQGYDKAYTATITLGQRTDTMDSTGTVLETLPVEASEAQIRQALKSFIGAIEQLPPMYSAKKMNGRKLYELARLGIEVEREPKKVTIESLTLNTFSGSVIEVEVSCSSGTYVRVLADDLGKALGCGAHMSGLRRTRVGHLSLADALPLAEIENDPAVAQTKILEPARALSHLPAINVSTSLSKAMANGKQLTVDDLRHIDAPPALKPEEKACVVTPEGALLGVVTALLPTDALHLHERGAQVAKTERIFARLRS